MTISRKIIRKKHIMSIFSNFVRKNTGEFENIDLKEMNEEYGMDYILYNYFDERESYKQLISEYHKLKNSELENGFFMYVYPVENNFYIGLESENSFRFYYIEPYVVKNQDIIKWDYARSTAFVGKRKGFDIEGIIDDIKKLSMIDFCIKYDIDS